jgi:hypothetical protein
LYKLFVYFGWHPFLDMSLANILSLSMAWSFHFLTVSLTEQMF